MKQLKITIYEGKKSKPETTITVPLKAIGILNALTPKKVKQEMAEEGIDLRELLKAVASAKVSGTLAEIEQKGKRIIISVE